MTAPEQDVFRFHVEMGKRQHDGFALGYLHHPHALSVRGVVQGPVLGLDDPGLVPRKTTATLNL